MSKEYNKEELFQQPGLNLSKAVKLGYIDEVKRLLSKKASLEVKDEEGFTVLMWAVIKGDQEITRLLIDAGANIDANSYSGSVLDLAVHYERLEIVKLLLEKGVDFVSCDQYGFTALVKAASKGNLRIMKKLLDAKTGKDRAKELDIALCVAAEKDQCAAIKMLIEAGADVNGVNSGKELLPLRLAVAHRSVRALELLMNLGADINFRSSQGETALMTAAYYGNSEMVETLIKAGADVNAKDLKDITPLMWAAQSGQRTVAEILIKAGADINAKNFKGKSAISLCRRFPEMKELLRNAGAKTTSRVKKRNP